MLKYFEPTKLERWRGGYIYERLGVRYYKRHLLPTEFLLHRLRRGKKQLQGGQVGLQAELKQLEWETRRNEVIHVAAIILTGCILVFRFPNSAFLQLSIEQFIAIFAINLYVNVYPILVQRYNRARMIRVREMMARKLVLVA